MSKETLTYQLVRGALHLADGTKVARSGSTDDPAVIKQLRELAEVKTRSGHAQYVILSSDVEEGTLNEGVIKPGEGDVKTTTSVSPAGDVSVQQSTVKYPSEFSESDIQQVEKALTDGGLTFESANALSDEDIRAKTEGIGPARLKIIRAVGEANGYPQFEAPETPEA